MNTLAQGTRWELKGDNVQPSILLLTMVDQGKSFPAFDPLTGQAIAESLVAVLDGKFREPIQSNGHIFRVARHELGAWLKVDDGGDGNCRETALLFEEASDLSLRMLAVIRRNR